MHTNLAYTPYEMTNPRGHQNAPFALRQGGGRPEGRFDTLAEALAAATPNCTIVTFDGWWIVGTVSEQA